MIISIWAMTEDGLIGKDNSMPWHIKEEFAHFRQTTLDKTLLMGKNTFLSLPKIFDRRKMYVISDDPEFKVEHPEVHIINDYSWLIKEYQRNPDKDLYITGGLMIYTALIPESDILIVSFIKEKYVGNRYLKNINWDLFDLVYEEDKGSFVVKTFKKKVK
ncbi:dihydrofolate reductase [Mesomycoplasma hyorhinis]|uniref:dihydrofolate reductase n=1 Tax=Mesomycoplasma hyorhinis TaxID=2100 RepID=UPI003DA66F9A